MKCLFSGEETSSEEHVVPRWMQRRFSLANQTYNLPNGTPIAYRNAKVPAAQAHNTKFGEIEDRLSRGVATLQEIYLWAFKIHVGLIHRSASLRIDIRSPSAPNFWKLEGFGQEIWLFQKLYAIWAAGHIRAAEIGQAARHDRPGGAGENHRDGPAFGSRPPGARAGAVPGCGLRAGLCGGQIVKAA